MIAHLALVPFAELPSAIIIAILFFDGRTPALVCAVILGFFLDVFSPVFGFHLVVYPIVVLVAAQLSAALLTDQSLPSFAVLSLVGYLTLRIVSSLMYFAVTRVVPVLPALPIQYVAQSFFVGLASQIVLLLFFYAVGGAIARTMSRSYSFDR